MVKKISAAPSPMNCVCSPVKPAPMTQPDKSSYGYQDTRQSAARYAAQDRLYEPPKTAPVVSMTPGAKNSWDK